MSDNVSDEQVDRARRWALIKFREIVRGARFSEQARRWLSGELGASYTFSQLVVLDDETKKFINDPRNAEKLKSERLV